MEIAARSLVLTVLSLLFVCGCDSTPEPRNLAVVNGTPITDVQVRDGIRVKAKIREFGGKKIPEKDFKKWVLKYQKVYYWLVHREQEKRCWQKLWPVKQMYLSFQFQVLTL